MVNCAYESEEVLFGSRECNPDPVTYQEVIRPLMLTKCAIPECHDGSDRSLDNYLVYGLVRVKAQLIKEQTSDRTMPPSDSGIQMTAQEIANIACWVEDGAPNN